MVVNTETDILAALKDLLSRLQRGLDDEVYNKTTLKLKTHLHNLRVMLFIVGGSISICAASRSSLFQLFLTFLFT